MRSVEKFRASCAQPLQYGNFRSRNRPELGRAFDDWIIATGSFQFQIRRSNARAFEVEQGDQATFEPQRMGLLTS
jgi:hypothetical protein